MFEWSNKNYTPTSDDFRINWCLLLLLLHNVKYNVHTMAVTDNVFDCN